MGRITTSALVLSAFVACAPGARGPSPTPPATPLAKQAAADPFSDLVMTTEDCARPPAETITRADALADIATVERVVRRGWAGFETRAAEGVAFDSIFADLRAWASRAAEPIRTTALEDALVGALRPLADNHLAFFAYTPEGHARRAAVGRHELAYTADLVVALGVVASGASANAKLKRGARVERCSVPLRPTVTEDLTPAERPIILADQPPPPMKCTIDGVEVALAMRRLRTGASKGAPFEMNDGPAPTLAVRTFWSAKETDLRRFVETGAKLRDAPAIVLDLRDNAGGSSQYGQDWAADLTSGSLGAMFVDRLDSEVTRQGIVNDNRCELAESGVDAAAKKEIEERLAYGLRAVDTAQREGALVRRWIPRRSEVIGRAAAPYRGHLVVLTNNACASACEDTIARARRFPRAIVVGENTGGVGVFAENLVYRLPRSGLGMSAGMKHFHDADAAFVVQEGRGHQPDLWLDGDEPLPLVQKIAACLAAPGCPLATK